MSKLELSSPWLDYARRIYVMFNKDPEVTVVYDPDDICVKLLVDNPVKAEAIAKILPTEKEYGNVVLKISVIPSNKEDSITDVYRKAFSGNPIFVDVVIPNGTYAPGFSYVVFKNEVAQYYNDRLDDIDGLASTLYANVAQSLFNTSPEIFFSTEPSEDFILWP